MPKRRLPSDDISAERLREIMQGVLGATANRDRHETPQTANNAVQAHVAGVIAEVEAARVQANDAVQAQIADVSSQVEAVVVEDNDAVQAQIAGVIVEVGAAVVEAIGQVERQDARVIAEVEAAVVEGNEAVEAEVAGIIAEVEVAVQPAALARVDADSPLLTGQMTTLHSSGGMDSVCTWCGSVNFAGEKIQGGFTLCCHQGKVSLPPLEAVPEDLQHLYTDDSRLAKNFRKHIRAYNSAIAFASMGANIVPPPGRGAFCFRIHGQIYHRTSPLHPPEGRDPMYAQLYILDSEAALEERMNQPASEGCLAEVMAGLQRLMSDVNPYAAGFRYLHEVELAEAERAANEGREVAAVRMFLYSAGGVDQRRYNVPRANEVAAIFVGQDGEPPANTDLVIYPRGVHGNATVRLSALSRNCDPMTYPLLFPRGEWGWHVGIQHAEGRRTAVRQTVTLNQFYAYRLAVRPGFSALHHAGKLFQQFIVDVYVRVEGSRVQYLREHQQQLRVDQYQGLMDYVHSLGDGEERREHGRIVILPSSFQGSPRAMMQNYQDAMAIVAKYGTPDLFLTFTCNPQWAEIEANLLAGQRAGDRPDLVARVFHLKLKEFLCDVNERCVLGKQVAYVYVIEYQKRGLPHCHLLLILHADDKLRTPEAINSVVHAEIPDPETQPRLHELVRRFMIHGPCGAMNPNCPCMKENKCSKHFPKVFSEETLTNVDGYPRYRRRENGRAVQVGGEQLDNRSVVGYNPWLLLKYEAHINVEVCSSVRSVKYIFKYVYKGHDCATVQMTERVADNTGTWNEIDTFLDARYVSAPEAAWRLQERNMHEHSHTIVRLAVHLPLQQAVYFRAGDEAAALQRAAQYNTTLTAWFKLNREDESARGILYREIPVHYVFDKAGKKWQKRRRGGGKVLGRMYFVSPADSERFHLRLLLLHVAGATSFENLRTVNGVVCGTFKEAARQLNLIDDDTEWRRSLEDAVLFQSPKQLRQLFAMICVFCSPQDALQLWLTFREEMADDFVRADRTRTPDNDVQFGDAHEQRALGEVQQFLQQHGTNCANFGLPEPEAVPNAGVSVDEEEERARNLAIADRQFRAMTQEQRRVMVAVLTAVYGQVDGDGEKCFFLDGAAGTGKTFVYNTLIHIIRAQGHQVIAVAWSGIAANLLEGGRTAHSRFRLPVPIVENSTCNIAADSRGAAEIRACKLIIWDEASMIPGHALIAVERCLRDILHNNNSPFGGKPFLLGGCFRQVLPVVRNGNRTTTLNACLKRCELWPMLKQLKLTENMRAEDGAQEFSQWLLQIGEGREPCVNERGKEMIRLPDVICEKEGGIDTLIGHVYGDLGRNTDVDFLSGRAILTATNNDTFTINDRVLGQLPGDVVTYHSVDSVVSDEPEEAGVYPTEFLNSLTPSGMPPHILQLKVGAIVILLRNIDTQRGLCNGTRLVIKTLRRNAIDTEVACGRNKGTRLFLPRLRLAPSDTSLPFTLCRKQFPIRLAFAMTINKAQGQTLDFVGLFLPVPVFSHGQLYVALSRAKNFACIKVLITHWHTRSHPDDTRCTRNLVYPELLH